MDNILIVGLGGIGSYLCQQISSLKEREQFPDTIKVIGYDDDTVEQKNIRYQCFTAEELYVPKAQALDFRFDPPKQWDKWFTGIEERLDDLDFAIISHSPTLIISAVDNLKFRKTLYSVSNIPWIDLRSEGRTIMVVTHHPKNSPEFLQKLVEGDQNTQGSCQIQADLDRGRIQLGNQIVANIGAQLILNFVRGEKLPPFYTHMF